MAHLFPLVKPSSLNLSLHSAAATGNLPKVDQLLQQAEGLDATTQANEAIRLAARNGHLALVEHLLQYPGIDLTANSNEALRLAAKNGHLSVTNRLLQVPGVDPSAQANEAIRMAAANGHLAIVDRLLREAGVDPTAQNNMALRQASKHGHIAIVDRLLQAPSVMELLSQVPDGNLLTQLGEVLRVVAETGDLALVNRLLEIPNLDVPTSCAIQSAALRGHMEVTERLLQVLGVDELEPVNMAVLCAAHEGHVDVLDRLLQVPGVDPTTHDYLAIQHAVENRRIPALARLLQVPELQHLAPHHCNVMDYWANNGDITWVEYFLRDGRVVERLGWAPEIAQNPEMRYDVAVERCAGSEAFRRQVVEAFRVAYECVKTEPYPGLAECLFQYVVPVPLAKRILMAQRGLAAALQRLRGW
eukprot:TRINITY_DN2111_c0_g4_i1.p1 TRINITY_DN2111_c0_g4~~TRINITY_DN2111_c0_g4_i1.p1  ORF type:complete len:436 (+),score=43.95 TRINITY_DN2111_c0_g4_i1:62-1309(+)